MTTQQNDTATLTDEQLEGVAGRRDVGPVSDGGRVRGSYVSISPMPVPTSHVLFPRPPWGPCVTSSRAGFDVGPIT